MLALEASAVATALQTAFQTISSNVNDYLVVILPVALGIVGLYFGVRWAIKFFKSIASK